VLWHTPGYSSPFWLVLQDQPTVTLQEVLVLPQPILTVRCDEYLEQLVWNEDRIQSKRKRSQHKHRPEDPVSVPAFLCAHNKTLMLCAMNCNGMRSKHGIATFVRWVCSRRCN
jgi:hypothetical protein